ncbi:MAG: hypothetical protein IJM14_07045 [Lachnospiraceae bacterium]|nr:hypothetical protein [Lachnospiraceae bacterium]
MGYMTSHSITVSGGNYRALITSNNGTMSVKYLGYYNYVYTDSVECKPVYSGITQYQDFHFSGYTSTTGNTAIVSGTIVSTP